MNIILSVLAVFCSTVLIHIFCRMAKNTRLMDKPNERSLHTTPTVRGGGVVFIGLSLLALPLICYLTHTSLSEPIVLIVATTMLAAVSFADDLYQLSAKLRLSVQVVAALLVVLFLRPKQLDFILFSISNSYFISLFLFFMVIWAINHFNFMDGLDGFCATQALFLLAAYAFFFSLCSAFVYQDFCMVSIGALVGFLLLNFPPARLFMGDVGSVSLGFIVFTIAVIAQERYQIPIVYWFLLNSLFLFDATFTLLRRIWNKEKWFLAHKKHAYQRLKQLGVSSRKILLGQVLINIFFFFLLLIVPPSKIAFLIILQLLIISFIYFLIEKQFPMYELTFKKRAIV